MYSLFFFFSSRRRHTRYIGDWSSDVCSSDLAGARADPDAAAQRDHAAVSAAVRIRKRQASLHRRCARGDRGSRAAADRKSTRLNSSHRCISYAVFCLKKKKKKKQTKKHYKTN